MKNQKRYRAFTLLELIISLIVIGIVATSFPLILQTSVNTFKTSAKEELFYQEFSYLQLINSLFFDENNTKNDNGYKDLNATDGDDELLIYKYGVDELNRRGKHYMDNNDFRSGSSDTVSHIGVDAGEDDNNDSTFDDIDDYNNYTIEAANNILKANIFYIGDSANYANTKIDFEFNYDNHLNNTNIKLIKISAVNDDVFLYYPTVNIGATKFLSLEEIRR